MAAEGSATVDLSVNGVLRKHRVIFLRNPLYAVIIGLDFIKAHQMHTDFVANTYYFGSDPTTQYRFLNIAEVAVSPEPAPHIAAIMPSVLSEIDEAVNRAPVDAGLQARLRGLLHSYADVFTSKNSGTHVGVHYIDTGSHAPIAGPPFKLTPARAAIVGMLVEDMLENDLIEPAQGPWAAPAMAVPKKHGTFRLVIDYRKLNAITVQDAYPMPRIDDLLDVLKAPRYITTLDLKSGYHQVGLHPESRPKAAFITPDGLFQPKVLQMGLTGAPKTFMRMMTHLFSPMRKHGVLVYLDDIIIASGSIEQHLSTLEQVLKTLRSANLNVNVKKTQLAQAKARILGHIVSNAGIAVDDSKTEAIRKFSQPRTVRQVRQFLGLAGYYRRFIANFASIAAPLTQLTKKESKFRWDERCQSAFDTLKQKLISAPVLATPDFSRPFILNTDASNFALGAVLQQDIDGVIRPVQFASRQLQPAERKYATTEREALAIVWAVKHFRPYLDMQQFTVFTDHNCLTWMQSQSDPTGRLTRWALSLQGYDMTIKYVKGKANVVADFLSRADESVHIAAVFPLLKGQEIAPAELSDEQQRDPDLNLICRELKTKSRHDASYEYKLDNNILYQDVGKAESAGQYRIVVPKPLRAKVISAYHDAPNCGHLGMRKTIARIREHYTWRGMAKDINKYVRSCGICQRYKASNQLPAGLMASARVEQPFEAVGVDLVGPLPRSKAGNTTLLVVHDYFTKFVQLFPMRTATAPKIAKVLVNKVFAVHGAPRTLVSDNGRQFVSKIIKEVASLYGIKQRFTSVYAPQSNQTERQNRTVKTIMAMFTESDHRDWDEALDQIASAINSSKQESTGYSPNYVMFGREIRLPQDPSIEAMITDTPDRQVRNSVAVYAAKLSRRVRDAIEAAKQHIALAQKKQKGYYDKRHRASEFAQGDLVLKMTHFQSAAADQFTKKLAPRFDGPFVVEEKLSPLTYRLSDVHTKKCLPGTHHVRNLKKWTAREGNE